jgi:hypothetical protein
LGVLGFDAFKFDCDLFTGRHIRSKVNISKRTAADLAAEAVLLSNPELHTNWLLFLLVGNSWDWICGLAERCVFGCWSCHEMHAMSIEVYPIPYFSSLTTTLPARLAPTQTPA